jgi:hypothetical protein
MSEPETPADVTAPPAKPPMMLSAEDGADEPAPAKAAPAKAAPAEPAKEPEPAKPEEPAFDPAAEVMRRRDAKELASIVREKKALEARALEFKQHEGKLAALAKIERLLEDEDDAGAFEAMLALKLGEKAGDRLPHSYNLLTERMLRPQNAPHPVSKEARGVSRIERELEEVKAREAQTRAKLEQREAEEYEHKVLGAKATLKAHIKDSEHELEALVTEADQPEEIVWEILEEADKAGKPLTVGEALKLANNHFKPAFERKAERYKNSLAPKKAVDVPGKPEAPTSKSAPQRKSLTNADASEVVAPKAPPKPRNEDERLDLAWQKLRQGSQTQ